MPATPEQVSLANDPSTDAQTLADLAHAEEELWPAISVHPNAYPALIDWMHENGMPESPASINSTVEPAQPPTEPPTAAANVEPASPFAATPATGRRLKVPLIAVAAVVVVVGLVLGGVYAVSSFAKPNGSGSAAAVPSSATDYRFGAKNTWKTKVNVVATASDGFAGSYANVQSYPGLWLVSWPGDDSGSGRLTDETLLGLDPDTGAVRWSMAHGPFDCASSLAGGALLCVNSEKGSLAVVDPSTGKPTGSSLNGVQATSVKTYQGDIVYGNERQTATGVMDTIERTKIDGTVLWNKSSSCDGPLSGDGMQFVLANELEPTTAAYLKLGSAGALLQGECFDGAINLNSGAIRPVEEIDDDGCLETSPFDDTDGSYYFGYPCESKYPLLIPRGVDTLTALTLSEYTGANTGSSFPTLWSDRLPGAVLSWGNNHQKEIVDLGPYAMVASAGHLYGVDTERGATWEQPRAFSGDGQVLLLPIDATKPNTPVLALDGEHHTVQRLDPGFGATRVTAEPAALPSCPRGQTPVSFTKWDGGRGATLVCQGFASTVTVVLIIDGHTYSTANGSITPTGYYADFGGNLSVDIGLGGWTAWVSDGGTTTLHAASSGWVNGGGAAHTYPALSDKIQACPADTYPLSLSTWHGGWLLTCGEKATAITRFVYVDGTTHGVGRAMSTKGGQSCGTDSAGRSVCVTADPAVVAFSSKGGSRTQRSVASNFVVGKGFSGAGKGTGAYGLADPKADAASEVAYLNGILQQSQAARASIRTVIQDILRCSSGQPDVDSANSVVAARSTELQALESAPVDAVPGGSGLVAQLRAVLQDSLAADQAYVTATGQVAGGDCPSGESTYNAQANLINQITSEKASFANEWNTQITTAYGVPSYTQDDI